MPVLVDCDKLPVFAVTLQDLGFAFHLNAGFSVDPHFLKLDSDLVEGLGDDGDEDVLHHPCQEENHGGEVQGGFPVLGAVGRPVHDVDPAFLTCCSVHGEDT